MGGLTSLYAPRQVLRPRWFRVGPSSGEENAELRQVYGNAENTVPGRMSSLDRAHFLDRELQNLDRVHFLDRVDILDRESRARSRLFLDRVMTS